MQSNTSTPEARADKKRNAELRKQRAQAWTTHGEKLARLFQHLSGCPRLTLGRAFVLSIGRTSYVAVRYSQVFESPQGAPVQGSHVKQALYVLGELPPSYTRNPGSVSTNGMHYRFDVRDCADAAGALAGDWYVAGYSTPQSQGEFGPNFLLFQVAADAPPSSDFGIPAARVTVGRGMRL